MVSDLTAKYWIDTLRGWAEDRLPPPQFDECRAVLDELTTLKTALRLSNTAQVSYGKDANRLSDELAALRAENEKNAAAAQAAYKALMLIANGDDSLSPKQIAEMVSALRANLAQWVERAASERLKRERAEAEIVILKESFSQGLCDCGAWNKNGAANDDAHTDGCQYKLRLGVASRRTRAALAAPTGEGGEG